MNIRARSSLALSIAALVSFSAAPSVSAAAEPEKVAEPLELELKGAPNAFYYKPKVGGLRPVLMFLHGRGGRAREDCKKWSRVARDFGWLVCAQGPEDRGDGKRGWGNNPEWARRTLNNAVQTLRAQYRGKVQTRNNILIGYSEGAFMAQQVGLKEPLRWNRWLILGASDRYWMGTKPEELDAARQRVRGVYLLTGEKDGVVERTKSVGKMLRTAKVPVRVNIVKGMGHEVPGDKMITNYRRPLLWLDAKK